MTDEKPRVIIIPPKPELQQTAAVTKQLRVAAYCRVSTKEEEQASSYEAQCEYYTDKIMSNKEWTMAGIFADEGITGTSTKKRTEFLRMIRQCKQKKIDLILTKSIQRFARNTLDCINYTRILRQLGIGVLFEKENINSLPPDSEFMITMYGAMAQSESESISGNIRRGRQMHAKVGTLKVPCYRLYGYEKDADGKFRVIPEQAEIVRELYKRYESGASLRNLQDWLEENQIKTVLGESKWTTTSIKGILTNEKYCGDVLLQKTFRADVISKKVIKNVGQPHLEDRQAFFSLMSHFENTLMIDTRFAPTTAGMDSKNENFTAKLRSKPRSIPALIVVPERESPGTTATACARPTTIASAEVELRSSLLPCPMRSAANSKKPVMTNAKPIKNVF